MTSNGSVLVVDRNRQHLAWLGRILRTLIGNAERMQSLDEIDEVAAFQLVVANYDEMTAGERVRLFSLVRDARSAGGDTNLLVISSARDGYRELFEEFKDYGLTNLLAKNGDVDASDLIVTVQKILRRDIFGIEKYFGWGVEVVSMPITSSAGRDDVLAQAEAFAGDLGVHPRLVKKFCTVVDELVTNALYNAPVDRDGRPRFAHLPRSEAVELGPSEEVVVMFCCDGQSLGVSVSDTFGALSKQQSLDYLARCFRRNRDQVDASKGGAGLGLYLTFDALSHFILNIEEGKRTEIIGLVDIRGSYRDFAYRSKSFNIFIDEAGDDNG